MDYSENIKHCIVIDGRYIVQKANRFFVYYNLHDLTYGNKRVLLKLSSAEVNNILVESGIEISDELKEFYRICGDV